MSQILPSGRIGILHTSHLITDPKYHLPEDLTQHHETSEGWLREAIIRLSPIFHKAGFELPEVRASIGWTSAGRRSQRMGECWATTSTSDGKNAIFISTMLASPLGVLDVLMHELVHAVDNCQHGHGQEFARIAQAVGLGGKRWASASAREPLLNMLHTLVLDLGKLPYGTITPPKRVERERNSGRAECPKCGFSCRTLSSWKGKGHPLCPIHKIPLLGDWD